MIKSIISNLITIFRKTIYFFHSNNRPKNGNFHSFQPVVLRGEGEIHFGERVTFGVINSPFRHASYTYLEARSKKSRLIFGNDVNINNAFSAIAECKISIGDKVLIGYNCSITDSNFHDLKKENRLQTDPHPVEVIIENNVFIGNNVTILKGVTIGENSVVSAGAIVTKSFPANVIIGGCPAVLIGTLD